MDNLRFLREEYILRLFAVMYNGGKQIEDSIKQNINKFLESSYAQNITENEESELKQTFIDTLKVIEELFTKDLNDLFTKKFPGNLFESIFIGVYLSNNKKDIRLNKDIVKERILVATIGNERCMSTLSEKANIPRKVELRANCVKEAIMGALNNSDIKLDDIRFFTKNEKEYLWGQQSTYGYVKCKLCRQKINRIEDAEIDHIIPWSKGGQTVILNAQLVHSSCNKEKSNK